MKEYCGRCRMSFRVEEPYHPNIGERQTHVTKCSESDCTRRFWHYHDAEIRSVIVGIYPVDAKVIP